MEHAVQKKLVTVRRGRPISYMVMYITLLSCQSTALSLFKQMLCTKGHLLCFQNRKKPQRDHHTMLKCAVLKKTKHQWLTVGSYRPALRLTTQKSSRRTIRISSMSTSRSTTNTKTSSDSEHASVIATPRPEQHGAATGCAPHCVFLQWKKGKFILMQGPFRVS